MSPVTRGSGRFLAAGGLTFHAALAASLVLGIAAAAKHPSDMSLEVLLGLFLGCILVSLLSAGIAFLQLRGLDPSAEPARLGAGIGLIVAPMVGPAMVIVIALVLSITGADMPPRSLPVSAEGVCLAAGAVTTFATYEIIVAVITFRHRRR
jgi:hypothetical protein